MFASGRGTILAGVITRRFPSIASIGTIAALIPVAAWANGGPPYSDLFLPWILISLMAFVGFLFLTPRRRGLHAIDPLLWSVLTAVNIIAYSGYTAFIFLVILWASYVVINFLLSVAKRDRVVCGSRRSDLLWYGSWTAVVLTGVAVIGVQAIRNPAIGAQFVLEFWTVEKLTSFTGRNGIAFFHEPKPYGANELALLAVEWLALTIWSAKRPSRGLPRNSDPAHSGEANTSGRAS